MRIVMLGTGPFAVPTFRWLCGSRHEVTALVTRPPHGKPGRGKPPVNPMREEAQQRGLPVFLPEDINSPQAREGLAAQGADLLVVCDYGQILSPQALECARLGGINLHASLLPKYRGAAPINWAMLQGETETGVTVIHMTPRLDAGPCLVQRSTPIGPEETAAELEARLAELGVYAVREAIELLEKSASSPSAAPSGTLGQVQDPARATRAPRLQKTDGQIDWTRTAQQIKNQVRALKPWPGTFTHWHPAAGEPVRLILDHVAVVDPALDASPEQAAPGEVVLCDAQRLWVATGDGVLSIERLQPAGRRVMATAEFLRGHAVRPGQRMG